MTNETQNIWIISDGKRGHLNQSLGLAEALQRRHPKTTLQILPLCSLWHTYKLALQTRQEQSIPSIIIAAGHATHISLLLLAKMMHVPSIVLMEPSLPLSWFELCIIPEHDSPPVRHNVVTSIGAINRIQHAKKEENTGLILIGGPSKYFGWDDDNLLTQIKTIIKSSIYHWRVTTSRRTPEKTVRKLQALTNIEVIPYNENESDANYLPSMLANTKICCVTEDSVSMIYEALTAGCQLKILTVPKQKNNPFAASIEQVQSQLLKSSSGSSVIPLAEADRCAEIVEQRFLQ